MRKPEKVRFELRTNQNLSRQNLQRAYESLSVEEPEIVNDIPVIGAFIRGLKHIVRKCIRWYVMPAWGKQKDYNQIVANMAEDYDRMHTLLMEENDILRSHVEQLQIQVTQLNARLQMRSIFELNANRAPRIIQLVSSLNFGDAVGNDALAIKHMLEGAGYATAIFTFAVHPKIKEENVYNIDLLPELTEDDIIIYHYASEDGFQKLIEETTAKVVLRYHNVTPPEFFHGYDEKAETITRKGLAQIKSMKDAIDYGMVDSEQNKKDLEQMGYEILQFNYRCRLGEIDLIAKDGAYYVFCEVKYRADERKGSPLEAVDARKQQKIFRTAMYYLTEQQLEDVPCRFDVVGIEGTKITLIKNAFGG